MKKIREIKSGNDTIIIKEVETRGDLRRFIRFPDRLYKGNSSYCPNLMLDEEENLRRDKNPAFEYCEARYFMAYKNGERQAELRRYSISASMKSGGRNACAFPDMMS